MSDSSKTTKKIKTDYSKNSRLKEFYEKKGLSQDDFADKIGASQQYISAVVNNKRNVGSNIINKIKTAFSDFDEYWFLTGNNIVSKTDNKPDDEYQVETASLRERLKAKEEVIKNLEARLAEKDAYLAAKDEIIKLLKEKALSDDKKISTHEQSMDTNNPVRSDISSGEVEAKLK